MNEHELSRAGERRKAEIGAMLAARARHRRVGRRAMSGAGCVLLLAGVVFVSVRGGGTQGTPPREQVVDARDGNDRALPQPSFKMAVRDKPVAMQVRIVTNDPLPTTKCDGGGSGSRGAVSVCLLDDSQLLAALTQTGQSYGLVKMGGKTRVVMNNEHQ